MPNTVAIKQISLMNPNSPSFITTFNDPTFLANMQAFAQETGLYFEPESVYNPSESETRDAYNESVDEILGRIFLSNGNGAQIKINGASSAIGHGSSTQAKLIAYDYRTPVENENYAYTLPTSAVLSHHTANVSASSQGFLSYVALGDYVLLGLSTGSPKYMDVMFDKKHGTISYFAPSSSTATQLVTILDSDHTKVQTQLKSFNDHASISSLAPLVIPSLGIVCDDVFVPFYMQAQERCQQFISNENTYFSSGCAWKYYNSSSSTNNNPHFVVRVPQETGGST